MLEWFGSPVGQALPASIQAAARVGPSRSETLTAHSSHAFLVARYESAPTSRMSSSSAVKNVTLTEEYLADHFPEFPVLPGVFMLEAATQAGAWLLRLSENFAHSIISLKEARNIKYADFVAARPNAGCHRVDVKEGRPAGHVESRRPDRAAARPSAGDSCSNDTTWPTAIPELRDTDEKIIQHFRRMQKLLLPNGVGSRRRLTARGKRKLIRRNIQRCHR